MKTKVTSDGEIQIPDVLLEQTGLKEGDEVEIEVQGDSLVVHKPGPGKGARTESLTPMEFLNWVRSVGLQTPSESTEWIREWRDAR
jgi:bifunctional DNA-binding transcriptional regulator/antitoxin component of YhaV-PrlF toxin-antitoxin module